MLPDLETVRCFGAAARLLHFRAAAREVALTPAALGQRIRHLEEQLGRRLFHRTTRTVMLTEAGLALVPWAERALAAADDLLRAGRGELRPPPLEVTVGTRHELGMSWVLPELPRLAARPPGFTIHLYFGSGADLLLRVRSAEIDCAIGSMRLTDPKLDAIRLHREDYALVGAPSLLAASPLTRPEHAARHTLVDTHAELPLFGYWRDAEGGGDRLRFGALRRMGTIAAIRELVLDGGGVAVLPLYLVRGDLRARRLRTILPRVRPRSDWFRLIFRRDDPRRILYQSLARALADVPLR